MKEGVDFFSETIILLLYLNSDITVKMLETKHNDICKELEARIKKGVYPEKLPGVHKLAKDLKASHITVSKALKELASQGLVTIINRKGAFVTHKNQDRPKYNIVCVAGGSGLHNNKHATIREITASAQEAGYKTIALGISNINILKDISFLQAIHIDGYIFIQGALDMEIARNLRLMGTPFVSLHRMPPKQGISWVDYGNDRGVSEVCRYFYKLGHRRIAYVSFPNAVEYHRQLIFENYRKTMEELGIFDKNYFCLSSNISERLEKYGDKAYEICAGELTEKLLQLSNPPTALFVGSLPLAHEIRKKLEGKNIAIPQDMSIVSSHLKENENDCEGFFTTLEADENKRASVAFGELNKLMKNPEEQAPEGIFIERVLKHRKSVSEIKCNQQGIVS